MSFVSHKPKIGLKNKKKPPPRPPPPNFAKYKSKSTFNLNQPFENLIEWSPPNSPTVERTHTFGGSVSSSFSSSTSSLASSKKSFEYDLPVTGNLWPVNPSGSQQNGLKPNIPSQLVQFPKLSPKPVSILKQNDVAKVNVPSIFGPTIIRAQVPRLKSNERKLDSDLPSPELPMPSIPPPSPPKEDVDVHVPYGIALYDYQATDPRDLSFQANDVIILLHYINSEWLYGRVVDKEGMFPANFIDIQVPLCEDGHSAMALYEFKPQMPDDLALKPGQSVKVLRKINDDWLYGESNGQRGQFPSNFLDRIPRL